MCFLDSMLRPARSSSGRTRPNSGVRQFCPELLDCDPPPCVWIH
jgi:hypothetical protein